MAGWHRFNLHKLLAVDGQVGGSVGYAAQVGEHVGRQHLHALILQVLHDHVDKQLVPSHVGRQLRMERSREQHTAAHRHDDALAAALRCRLLCRQRVGGEWLDAGTAREHRRRADEHCAEVRGPAILLELFGCGKLRLKAVDLGTEKVARHGDVQPTYQRLAALLHTVGRVGEENHAGAGAPDGLAGGREGPQLWNESPSLRHECHGGGLAARDDEAMARVQLLLGSDLQHGHAWDAAQQGHVLAEGALERQDADADSAGSESHGGSD
mmetsp:Transcript_19878/g.59039  ORF Transcript_19878/g.59039 Transcript_19878/m.59039 type:complete len:268 (-) Transcript_19878:222-1025(-)